jgi:hypothetical protein
LARAAAEASAAETAASISSIAAVGPGMP